MSNSIRNLRSWTWHPACSKLNEFVINPPGCSAIFEMSLFICPAVSVSEEFWLPNGSCFLLLSLSCLPINLACTHTQQGCLCVSRSSCHGYDCFDSAEIGRIRCRLFEHFRNSGLFEEEMNGVWGFRGSAGSLCKNNACSMCFVCGLECMFLASWPWLLFSGKTTLANEGASLFSVFRMKEGFLKP